MSAANPSADRNLLFGILALQMDFITRDQLVAGMNAWVLAKHQPLGTILREQNALDDEQHDVLNAMVQVHLKKHQGDPEKSLAAMPASSWLKEQIRSLCHPDVEASSEAARLLGAAGLLDDPYATRSFAVGASSSAGSRFQILRPHAEGGLGKVSVALDDELHREVALKEIKERHADNANSRDRFVLEAEITGGLEHPGIVPVYGLGHYQDGRPFYAMRFIRGDSLKDAIGRFHRSPVAAAASGGGRSDAATDDAGSVVYDSVPFRQLLGRFVDVCNAIAYAHSRGVLHRDLKPGNIMLGKYGETLVVDWGLAKAQSSPHTPCADGTRSVPATSAEPPLRPKSASSVHETVAGSAIGTPAFMSPEQAAGRLDLLGPASDIYSLGATLFTLLFNRPPVQGNDTGEILRKVQLGEIDWQRGTGFQSCGTRAQDRSPMPQPLIAICKKAMALNAADRYATPLDLAADIEHWLADEPVAAYGEPWSVRTRRWARKHRTLVTSAAAVLLVASIGSIVAAALLTAKNTELAYAYAAEQAAKTSAQENEERAKTEAATAIAVKKFLQEDLLQLAAASEQHREAATGIKMDPDLKVRDLVLRAAQKIEGKFPDQPLVEAEIRGTLGWTLREIGRNKEAIPQYLRVRELYTAKLGPDHPHTLDSMNHLASSYADAGRTQEALKLYEETLQLRKAKLGPDHLDTLGSMHNLASSYADAGRTQEALKLREETLQLQKAKLGPDHPDTLRGMNNLAASYAAAARTQEALKLREETLQLRKAKLGPDHPETLISMHNMAISYAAAGRAREVLTLSEGTFQLMKAKLGPDHPETLMSMNSLALAYIRVAKAAEAVAMLRETLTLRERRVQAEPNNNVEQSLLAFTHGLVGEAEQLRLDIAAAVQAYAKSVEIFEKLDQDKALKKTVFRERMSFYQKRLAVCRKAEQSVKDLDFALQQPPAEVPHLLDMRVRFLLKEQKLPAAIETAAKMKERAKQAAELYDAACLYALCAGAAKPPAADAARLAKEYADEAMTLLTRAVLKGYTNAGHMKQDRDLEVLRGRPDFQKLLGQLEAKK